MATKYYTKSELIRLNNKSIKENRNQCLSTEKLKNLNPKYIYPVMQTLFHNDKEMRTIILFDENNNKGILDISIIDYNKLNTFNGTQRVIGGSNVN